MGARQPFVVFYSWQSDLPNKTNRGLIEASLEKACKELRADLELAIRVDADIQDVPGSPDIAATILDKIDRATVVVADVSIIGTAPITTSDPPTTRTVPNPNVMFELGYAKRALGPERVIMVCNTAYGRIEDLPFDIRSKGVLKYEFKLNEGEKPAGPRNDLAGRLKAAIAAALEFASKAASRLDEQTETEVKRVQTEQFQALRTRLADALLSAPPVPIVTEGPLMALHLVPATSLDGVARVDFETAKRSVLSEMSPLGATGWSWFYDVDSLTAGHALREGQEHWTFTRLFNTGAVEVVWVFSPQDALNSIAYTSARALATTFPILGKLGLDGRWFVSIDVLRAKGAIISTQGRLMVPGQNGRPIASPTLSPPPESAEAGAGASPALLKSAMDWIWRAAGFEKCWYFDDQGKLAPA